MRTILLVLLLTGCSSHVYEGEILSAEAFCKDHGGVNRIRVSANQSWVHCQDGSHQEITVK